MYVTTNIEHTQTNNEHIDKTLKNIMRVVDFKCMAVVVVIE